MSAGREMVFGKGVQVRCTAAAGHGLVAAVHSAGAHELFFIGVVCCRLGSTAASILSVATSPKMLMDVCYLWPFEYLLNSWMEPGAPSQAFEHAT